MSLTDQNTTIIVSMETRDVLRGLKRGGETYDAVIRRLMKDAESRLDPNDLCPRGWVWLIGSCDFGQDCLRCTEDLAPLLRKKIGVEG